MKMNFLKHMRKITTEEVILASLLMVSAALLAAMIAGFIDSSSTTTMAMAGLIVTGTAGGKHVADAPLTTSQTRVVSPELLRSEIDDRITKIRPSATPIDQISRSGGSRRCGSMIVDYYSVDTKPTATSLKRDCPTTPTDVNGCNVYTISTNNDKIFEASETILVPSRMVANESTGSSEPLILYVLGRNDAGGIDVTPVNGPTDPDDEERRVTGTLAAGDKLVRMGRAATELDVQTPQFNALPRKATNFCQIFKAQIEESTLQKLSNKEVGWGFNDQEEVAMIDMRMGMERNFMFGSKARIVDPRKQEEVMLTGGIWNQAGQDFTYDASMKGTDFINAPTRKAFTGNCGSTRKILMAGSGLIGYINSCDYTRSVGAGDIVTHWGIDFRELHSKFGTLYVIHSEVFDNCMHENDGMVIDPEYMTKYCHIPFSTERLDLKKSGQRNTDAVVLTEASCLVLRHPMAHIRVVRG